MFDQVEISVIVPVYNAAATIDRSIGSIVNSQCKSIEVLCINDGSTDDSKLLLQQWASRDSRIHIYNQENAGVSAARNLALQHARGQYLVFVDADDEITPTYLSNLLDAAIKHNADVVICGQQQINRQGTYSSVVLPFRNIQNFSPVELSKLPPSVCSHLYARKALQTPKGIAQFPLNIRYGEDTAFHFSVYPLCKTVVQIEENGYLIYYTEGSSNSRASTIVFDMIKATDWLVKQYQLYDLTNRNYRECIVLYALHTMRRIHSLGLHSRQTEAAQSMRKILIEANISMQDLSSLSRKNASILANILRGRTGLNFSYYFKRIKKWFRKFPCAHSA